jgi:hypothetical protein
LRSREEDPAAAMAVLDMSLSDAPRQAMPHAFFVRLLRARLSAKQGSYAASLALLMQMEERCEFWFTNETERADATRTVVWAQLLVLRDWIGQLTDESQTAGRRRCQCGGVEPTKSRLHLGI